MSWTGGYASDIAYTSGYYREQSPSFLNFVCLLNGFEPIPLHKPFHYLELGFGRGFTANLLAASNPRGNFYAVDFNPSHVAGARQMAESAQLSNLKLLENSFEDLALGSVELPEFDFITLHGIYTWVNAENQKHIAKIIQRYLKPGGIVYISYNAMPGWAAMLPIQRLLVDHADHFPGRSDDQLKAAIAFIDQMKAHKMSYGEANPTIQKRMETMKSADGHYLVHEYMHRHWKPLYHSDILADMQDAKLEFAGSADLALTYPDLFLSAEKQQLLKGLPNSAFSETCKDYFLNTSFRKDVFVRGLRPLHVARREELLADVGLVLRVPRDKVHGTIKLPLSEVKISEEVYAPMMDVLAEEPTTLGKLSQHPKLKNMKMNNLAQICAVMVMSNQVECYFASSLQNDSTPAKRLNLTLAQDALHRDDLQAFASPLLGHMLSTNFIERMIYALLCKYNMEQNAKQFAIEILEQLDKAQRYPIVDGKVSTNREENTKRIEDQVKEICALRLPLWKKLQMI